MFVKNVTRHSLTLLFLAILVLGGRRLGAQPAGSPSGDRFPFLAPPLDVFDQWRQATGEQPPDLSQFKPIPGLPPLRQFTDGRPVNTPAEWAARRAEMRELLQQWIYGHAPAGPPPAFKAEIIRETPGNGGVDREVRLTLACPKPVSFVVHVLLPAGPGPFPIFMTQWNHKEWAALGVARGYLSCYYPGADVNDETAQFAAAYPKADWALLMKRAWMASRVLDYLVTLPQADKAHVALTGHSRNGKQSLVCAAFDERITAVVASSAGSGGSAPWRFTSDFVFNESVERMTSSYPARLWFTPRLRFFTGRENLLPIDNHALLGLIAPRACLFSVAVNDGPGTTFGDEQEYRAGGAIYKWLGQPEALRLLYRPNNHETTDKDIENYFDWFDTAFGRMKRAWPETLLHAFDWQAWRARQGNVPTPPPAGADASAAVAWGLGEAPATVKGSGNTSGAYDIKLQAILERESFARTEGITCVGCSVGEYMAADLYFKKDAKGPLPVVLWLHGYAYNCGYGAVTGLNFCKNLARQGYLVVAWDQAGCGVRQYEKPFFYDRYPKWSLLGKQVRDVQAVLDCLLAGKPTPGGRGLQHDWLAIPPLDPARVTCVGYSMGGMVGLYATALDPRITGVASLCGFTPLRSDTVAKPTGGLRRLWELYAMQPRLGLYDGRESELPYDYDDILRLIAPRRCLVWAPLYDREADAADVRRCVDSARPAWQKAGRAAALRLEQPVDYNRFYEGVQKVVIDWLGEH